MSGDKRKNNKNNRAMQPQQIKKETVNEMVMSEEDKKILNGIEEMCDKRIKEADEYYQKKLKEADGLKEKAEKGIQNKVDEAVRKKEKEMKSQIEEAKKEAEKILKGAEDEAREKIKKAENREIELEEKEKIYIKNMINLEEQKSSYKQEIFAEIKEKIDTMSEEKANLEKEVEQLKGTIKRKDSKIVSLEEDKAFCYEEIEANSIKKSDILFYKTQLSDLENANNILNDLYKKQQDKVDKLNSQILLYGDNPLKAIKENSELSKKIEELEDFISNCPSTEELEELRETNKKYETLNNKLELLESEKLKLEIENNDLRVKKDEIEAYRRFIKILELQKSELQRELNRNIELYNNKTEKVFANLSLIDEKECDNYPSFNNINNITLKLLCERFRGFLMNRKTNPLYYEEKTIRTFIAGFASSRIMILEGLSGTGKSSLPRAFADFMGSKTLKISVQSSWKDRNDLLGFYNDFKKQYKETEFLKALYTATHDKNNIYIIVLDEMNLSRIEYYFADLLSVLENPDVEEWKIELISDFASISTVKEAWPKLIHEGKLQISDNTWFVGTANKDDSTFMITDKVYDRAVVLNFEEKGKFEEINSSSEIKMNYHDFQHLLDNASIFKNDNDGKKFKEMIEYLDENIRKLFQITFGNRIENQLKKFVPAYISCGGTVEEAIDVMFSRKVLRKLEGIYDENTKENLEIFKEDIKQKYKMPVTIKAIEKMVEKI